MADPTPLPHHTVAVYAFDDDTRAARKLAAALDTPCVAVNRHRFPDGESLVAIPESAATAILYRPLNDPNAKLVECLLAADAFRENKCTKCVLAAPYLGYMRQDIAFHAGEAVSQKVLGSVLSPAFDAFVTVEPHLHRTASLDQVFAGKPSYALTAGTLMGDAIRRRFGNQSLTIIGPDEESAPLTQSVADAANADWTVGTKVRHGDRNVELTLPDDAVLTDRTAIIVDDVISSGTTIIASVDAALTRGATAVHAYATHALCTGEDAKKMTDAGLKDITSCDGVIHPSNGIALAPLLARGVRQCL